MNSGGNDNSWSTAGRGAPTAAVSAEGFVASTTRGGLRSAVIGRGSYQPFDIDSGVSIQDANPAAESCQEVELLSDIEGTVVGDKSRRVQGAELKYEYRFGSAASDPSDVDNDDKWMRNVWGLPNLAVMMSYFSVGFAIRFLLTPLSYYMVEVLGVNAAQLNVVMTLAGLPWSFKLVYGFISDNFPIGGMRRKPYFIAGWTVYVLMNFITATQEKPSLQLLACYSLVSTMGFMMSDVATDAILVERSKHEPRETRGSMQATGYTVRFLGSLLGSSLGMVLNTDTTCALSAISIRTLFVLNGMFPLVFIGPFVWHLRETEFSRAGNIPVVQHLLTQCGEIFGALEQKAVFIPMAFIFVYNVFQVPNAAWKSFLLEGLEFSSCQIGVLAVVASLMASVGLWVYKTYFFNSSWRKLYVWTTLVVAFFSAFQLLLIQRVNKWFGISDLTFSIGDDSIADLVSSIQFLPIIRMYISMCPDGVEGTTYAILTTMSNVSASAAYNVGTHMTKIWDVSNEALRDGNFTGMWKLTLLTSLLQPLPLVLIRMLPANIAEQRTLQAGGIRYMWGGILLLVILFASLGWTIIVAVYELG
ncbi:unnamed protein product [Ascophyllum nodosum]